MTARFRPEVLRVTESPLVTIATMAEAMPGSIKLCYGESDMTTPEFICSAASDALRAGHTFYTNPAGYSELRSAISEKIFALQGVRYNPSEIMCAVGGTMAIYASLRACLGTGDNVVIISPAYAIYANGAILAGAEPRQVPLSRNSHGFSLDVDRLRAAIDSRTRMIVVNSPSNPAGWMITNEEQVALAQLADGRDIIVLSDEVYERLVFDAPIAPSMARVIQDKDRLIVINSFSKTYNMTGWRLGWAQSGERLVRLMTKAVEFMTSNPSAMVQQAGIVALRDGEDYVSELRAHYAARRRQVSQVLGAIPGVSLPEPRGAFYAFFGVDGIRDSAAFALELLRATGVAVAPGSAFGPGGEGNLRICFAASEGLLSEALARVAKFVGQNVAHGRSDQRPGN
jgi:aspartate/methionine/tyrosine aminotransferase